jgi:hypothetical protein
MNIYNYNMTDFIFTKKLVFTKEKSLIYLTFFIRRVKRNCCQFCFIFFIFGKNFKKIGNKMLFIFRLKPCNGAGFLH